MVTGNTGGQAEVNGVPHPNLFLTHMYTHTLHSTLSTDPLHPYQGLENTVLLKDAAEISWHYGCGVQGSTSHRRHSLSPKCEPALHTTSALKDVHSIQVGRVPGQESGR